MDICTIIAKNYVAQARVLAESFAAHHPGGTCSVLVLDEAEGYLSPASEPFEILTPADLGIDGFERMSAIYDIVELSTAVKPWLLRTLLEREGIEVISYLDPDIEVFASLGEIDRLIAEHGLVLIPHVTEPMPRDGLKPSETDILIAGVYNLGFIGIGRGQATDELLDWWAERLETDCRVDPERGYFVDQRWMDFAPAIVPSLKILREPGYDVAYWNLPGRRLGREEGRWTVNGVPLRFFHFSGYDPDHPHQLSRHQDRVRLRDHPVLAELCHHYGQAVLSHGYRESQKWQYTYGRLADGTRLDSTMRRLLIDALEEGAVGDPVFSDRESKRYVKWLQRPADAGAAHGINRFLAALHERRPDLQRLYPRLDGPDGRGFAGWARTYGAKEVPIPEALLPPVPAGEGGEATDGPGGSPEPSRWGVNVVGYLRSELGVGEAARQVIAALDAHQIAVAPVGMVAPLSRQGHMFAASERPEFPYAVNVVCVNADGFPGFVSHVGMEYRRDRYTIGLWFWEVSTFPSTWEPSFGLVDEVWAATDHVRQALLPAATVPVTKVTVPIEPVATPLLSREHLKLPEGLLFVFTFDYNSVFERKNPLGLVEAFTRAFPKSGEATLLLKSINHENDEQSHEALKGRIADRPDIRLMDRYLTIQEKNSLVAASDCYVSLHRSEGLGITMGEAMYYGKAVIATGYSGNLDFMTNENSLLVDHSMVPIGPGTEPYPPDGEWADPDLDQAAAHMRWVVDHPKEAEDLGGRAQASIRRTHSAGIAGQSMVRRLNDIRPIIARSASNPAFADQLLQGIGTGDTRERVRAGAKAAGHAGGARGRARDVALRAMQPFTVHEREVDEAILEVIDQHIGGSARGLGEVHRRALTGDFALQAHLRAVERGLRAESTALQAQLRAESAALQAQLREEIAELRAGVAADNETRVRRLEPERARPDRWPAPKTPWTHAYNSVHRSFVAHALDDVAVLRLFATGADLPPAYGIALDERVVEYPWLFAQPLGGRALDAGSVLNHAHILERFRPLVTDLTIATLVSEAPALPDAQARYDDADLRKLPYDDGSFETVVCVSTLDHVGMDNTPFGADAVRAADPQAEALQAVGELRRVTAPGGRVLITVPYGRPEDLGWVRQVGRSEVWRLVEAAQPCSAALAVYRYTEDGWGRSTLDEAADEHYRDYTADQRQVADLAAAARAVACIALSCP